MSTPYPLLPPDMEPDPLSEAHWLEDGGHDLPPTDSDDDEPPAQIPAGPEE